MTWQIDFFLKLLDRFCLWSNFSFLKVNPIAWLYWVGLQCQCVQWEFHWHLGGILIEYKCVSNYKIEGFPKWSHVASHDDTLERISTWYNMGTILDFVSRLLWYGLQWTHDAVQYYSTAVCWWLDIPDIIFLARAQSICNFSGPFTSSLLCCFTGKSDFLIISQKYISWKSKLADIFGYFRHEWVNILQAFDRSCYFWPAANKNNIDFMNETWSPKISEGCRLMKLYIEKNIFHNMFRQRILTKIVHLFWAIQA